MYVYVCENCGHEMYPDEPIEKCRICGEPVEGEKISSPSKAIKLLKKHKERILEIIEKSPPKFGKIEDGKLILETDDGEVLDMGSVDEVNLKIPGGIPGGEIGRVKNPDYAEFPKIRSFEKSGDDVELTLESPKSKEKEFLEKIEELREGFAKKE